ncbi:MAG: signal peptide peptidase SppA [Ignavibacteria bacterium]|nr:signal peptide peptidase SppA [Ignavibacteria bacterium]
MKAKLTLLVFVITLFSVLSIKAQDFNLFNPSNELYLFSAYDEGSNAFRYNPAVLGLGHRLNMTVSGLMHLGSFQGLNELDISVNAGFLGLGYRRYTDDQYVSTAVEFNSQNTPILYTGIVNFGNYNISTYSLGFGAGNRAISTGLLLEFLQMDASQSPSEINNSFPSFRLGLGFLFRPSQFLSFSFVYKGDRAMSILNRPTDKFTLGTAIRPLKNDRLSIMADFSSYRYGKNFFDYNSIKAGLDLKLTNGLFLNVNYTRNNDLVKNEFLGAGFRFDLPNGSIRYNQFLNNSRTQLYLKDDYFPEYDLYRSTGGHKYSFIGSQFSLSYNVERRKSIIPEKKKIVEITLSGSLQDYNTEDVFFGLLGSGKRSIHEVIGDIDYAAADPSVKGMILKIYPLASGRFEITAAIEELTASMSRFRAKNKTITVYFPQDVGPGGYYISTFADDVVMPAEAIFYYGLSVNVFNYNSFLEKYGIDLQTFYAGKYKLTFQGLLDSTTEEGKEVINRVLDIVYEKMLSRIVTGRNLTLDDYLLDKLSQPLTGSEAYRLGLVDKLGWYDDAKEIAGKNSRTNNIVRSFNRSEWETGWGEPPQIAVIGVYASITTGESQPPPPLSLPIPFVGGGRSTGSETVVKQLEEAFSNPKVKAIVLRVDSGGGSALGSAEINSAIIRLKKKYKKPFIVSMGGAAASGGYYVSVSADKIFSDELTITGSIGVFTARPNLDSLLRGQKIKVENFKRGENSDIGSFYKELDEKEVEIIQGIIDYYYDRFTEAVAEGRKMSKEEAEQVAQGRVWLGTDAFNKKLVDEIGGLYEAVQYAKKRSKISGKYKIVYYSVPGGNKINEIMTSSVIGYFHSHLIDMLGIDETNSDGLEIKY